MLSSLFRRFSRAEPDMRMASIYRRQGKTYVTASSRTRDIFWLEEGPVDVLSGAQPDAIADSVRSALARSRHGIAAPKDWASHVNRVVEAAGLKRFNAFAKGTALVTVEGKDKRLRILPNHNGGSRKGYLGLEDQALEIAADSPDLADAIETAFSRCT